MTPGVRRAAEQIDQIFLKALGRETTVGLSKEMRIATLAKAIDEETGITRLLVRVEAAKKLLADIVSEFGGAE
jgi:hypothetical protein